MESTSKMFAILASVSPIGLLIAIGSGNLSAVLIMVGVNILLRAICAGLAYMYKINGWRI